MPDFEDPWSFPLAMAIIWVVIFGVVELVLFDGDLLNAVILGIAGGLVFGFVYPYIQRGNSQ